MKTFYVLYDTEKRAYLLLKELGTVYYCRDVLGLFLDQGAKFAYSQTMETMVKVLIDLKQEDYEAPLLERRFESVTVKKINLYAEFVVE
jgi:predicted DNA-binding helix-hairpin-helix protein